MEAGGKEAKLCLHVGRIAKGADVIAVRARPHHASGGGAVSIGPDEKTESSADGTRVEARPRLLAIWSGGFVVRDLPDRGELVIGRGDDPGAVRIDHSSVSRRHARLVVGEDLRLEDLGSSNGTFVAGERIAPNEPCLVAPGMLIEIGTVMVVLRGAGASLTMGASRPSTPPGSSDGIVILDPAMDRLHQLLELASRSDLSILLLGETGVGKEVIASRVHALSSRSGATFLKINCAALVESLLEAELFGYERGAFTGANQARAGLLESASGGTLFLDEVGEMPMQTQAKLLRALETGEITRVGSTKTRTIDVRFVAATNQDLRKAIQEGRFRQDLYFRLEGVVVRVPPLRERTTEIAPLVRMFAAQAAERRGLGPVTVSEGAMLRLVQHPWPGNLRELKNLIFRTVLLTRQSVIGEPDLQFDAMGLGTAPDPSGDDVERRRILDALDRCGGNQTRAAKMLGISRGTLVNRLNLFGTPRPRK